MDRNETDDDSSVFGTMDEREAALGFRPQNETPYNALLPYADSLDAESTDQLAEIKSNYARVIQLRDIKFGGGHWTGQLAKYIRMFGLKFSKQDHLTFIRLTYELVTLPDLDYSLVHKFAQLLVTLLKKRELIPRGELVLPWRPLYKLLEMVVYSPYDHHGLVLLPVNIELILKNLVRACRVYFPVESTQEMLDEWRPLLCPFDVKMIQGIYFLEIFLPTILYPEEHSQGFCLWFEELIGLWQSCQNSPPWETNIQRTLSQQDFRSTLDTFTVRLNLINLLSRLANDCIGYINWEPYMDRVFTDLLRSFRIPVGSKHIVLSASNNNSNNVDDMTNICRWISAMFGNGSSVQSYLDRLFKSLESFYHPSNIGRWSVKLMKFLSKLPFVFVKRVQREKWRRKTWQPEIPVAKRLTDDEVSLFVKNLAPVIFTAMFSKTGSSDAAVALQNLASLRPELVIPTLLEKTYPALETLTEPHRLIACLQCVVSVARSMLISPKWYPEGRMHVIPLLSLSLPGIDPNDVKKSLMTFQLLSTLSSLVPIVDCSEAPLHRNDLTEVEAELCSATAQFEDFVLQFFDSLLSAMYKMYVDDLRTQPWLLSLPIAFALIENSSHQHTRSDSSAGDKMNQEEAMLEICLLSTSNAILQQCSTAIYNEALSRLYRFASESIFEIKVAGRFTADLVRAAIKVQPQISVKKFIVGLCEKIISRATSEDLSQEEHLDNEFLWNLLLLSQVVRCDGSCLVPYEKELTKVLQVTLHLKCKDAQEWSGSLLRYLLKSLSSIYSLDYRSTTVDWDKPLTEVLPIREWGKSGDLHNLGIKWHIPNQQEKDFTQHILETFLLMELKRTRLHCDGETVMSRDELLQCVRIINHCLIGAGASLLQWKSYDLITLIDSSVEIKRFGHKAACDDAEITLEGDNVRVLVSKFVRPLLGHMLSTSEDDTKTLVEIIKVYSNLMYYYGTLKDEFDNRWKTRHNIKRFMENKVQKKKTHLRALLVDRTQLQHELRTTNQAVKLFTVLHGDLFKDLHRLAVSRYMEVRKGAQAALNAGFLLFSYSYRTIIDDTIKYLKDDQAIAPHQFKGALYMILGDTKGRSLVSKRCWDVMNKLWPALVETKNCEKPSVLKLYDEIIDRLHKNVETTDLSLTVPESTIAVAKEMWTNGSLPKPSLPSATNEEMEKSRTTESDRNKENIKAYHQLVNSLVNLANSGNLGWRFHQVSLEMLTLLIRCDIRFPPPGVRLFVNNMINSSLNVRKICVAGVCSILKLQKRKHKLREIDPYAVSNVTRPLNSNVIHPGDRPDNQWLYYSQDSVPTDEEKWQKSVFIEKTHWGFYCWPKQMMAYAPMSDQPPLGRTLEELPLDEQPIYEAFTNKEFVEALVRFMTLEENKGKDRFHEKLFSLFKGLFRNFDDMVLPYLAPHVERLVADTSHNTHETSQRCAAEVISGLVRGSKHWGFTRRQSMWKWLIPLIKTVLSNFTVESIADWGTCFATASENQDPRKISPLLELMMDNPLNGDGGSFGDSSRMYLLQAIISQQEWRVPEVLHRLYAYLLQYLSHPFKNVRDRLGSTLVNLFLYDVKLPNSQPTQSPGRAAFIRHVLPLLEPLRETLSAYSGNTDATMVSCVEENVVVPVGVLGPELMNVTDLKAGLEDAVGQVENHVNGNGSSESPERKNLINLCKTMLKTLQGMYHRMFQAGTPELLQLLPVICLLESEAKDPELTRECLITLGYMSQAVLTADLISPSLDAIEEVSRLNSWHGRAAVLGYLQVMVFNNLFLLQDPPVIARIRSTVLSLLCNEQLEVRELAGVTLGGFLHCGFLKIDADLMNRFKQLSSTRIKKRSRDEVIPSDHVIKRHAGVIGLSACILAFPYQVPDFMPQLLMHLSSHLNDPPPIQTTVKKTLATFKRTHLDCWHDHKQKFTDDQLVVLTELLVSPNYYA